MAAGFAVSLKGIKKRVERLWVGGLREGTDAKVNRWGWGLTVTEIWEIWADIKGKGQRVVKNMKDKDGDQEGFQKK